MKKHYGLTLGDITHDGHGESLERYLTLRDNSTVPRWFEIAGNHEHRGRGIRYYQALIGQTEPYCFVDGNLAWFFISDERGRLAGNVTDKTRRWLRAHIDRHREKIIIVLHQ